MYECIYLSVIRSFIFFDIKYYFNVKARTVNHQTRITKLWCSVTQQALNDYKYSLPLHVTCHYFKQVIFKFIKELLISFLQFMFTITWYFNWHIYCNTNITYVSWEKGFKVEWNMSRPIWQWIISLSFEAFGRPITRFLSACVPRYIHGHVY